MSDYDYVNEKNFTNAKFAATIILFEDIILVPGSFTLCIIVGQVLFEVALATYQLYL